MRMKKIILIAAVAIAAAACSKTFDTNLASEKAIGFGTWAENLTKAPHNNAWANDDAFKVFGTKTVTDQSVVFDGEEVSYNTTDTKWSYAPVKFWDLTANNYTFYAFLPAAELADEASTGLYATTGKFASKEVTFNDPTSKAQDILVASEYSRAKGTNAMSTASVDLEFNHMATLVDVRVKMNASLATMGNEVTLAVTSATLADIRYKGTLNVTGYASPVITGVNTVSKPQFSDYGWTPDATPSVTNYASAGVNPLTAVTTYNASGNATTTDPEAQYLFQNYVVMPQDLSNGQKLVISYTITTKDGSGNTATAVYNDVDVELINFVDADNTSNTGSQAITGWLPNVHYIYYVTIGANAITFTASVNPWETTVVNGYRYILN